MNRPDDLECWEAVVRRDGRYDGRFFFGVVTTGVYCRPSCRSRRPRRENVRFFTTWGEAWDAGFRACLRCRPAGGEDPRLAAMNLLCDEIRNRCRAGEPLTLASLAEHAGMSASRLRRSFAAVVGVTPRQFAEACRLEILKEELRTGGSVTRAIYEAGFGSSSRVYERVDSRLGMTPSAYRSGGLSEGISYTFMESLLGLILIAATDRGICFVHFGESRERLVDELEREFPGADLQPMDPASQERLGQWVDALDAHLRHGEPHVDLPLDVRASAFRFKVWRYLQSIPRGETRSYGEVAEALGRPGAARAVAGACAANPVAVLIPCHRVIRANGDLGGYRWGVDRKARLLEREQAAARSPAGSDYS